MDFLLPDVNEVRVVRGQSLARSSGQGVLTRKRWKARHDESLVACLLVSITLNRRDPVEKGYHHEGLAMESRFLAYQGPLALSRW